MQGKWRNRLKRAEESGLEITHQTPRCEDLHWLLQKDTAQQRRKGFRALPHAFLQGWQAAGGGLSLFSAHHKGQRLAAMLFLEHTPGVSYHIGWTSLEGRKKGAHNLILWQAMQELRETCQRLDLGQIDTVNTPGLARFKLGAGAEPVEIGPTRLILPVPHRQSHQPIGTTRTGTAL